MSGKEDAKGAAPSASKSGRFSWNGFSRRNFVKLGAGLAGLATSLTAKRSSGTENPPDSSGVSLSPSAPVEYIVIGSGAGGGPLAVNLAKAGHKVVLFEAGGYNDAEDVSSVPLFLNVVEDPRVKWDYFVRHYADEGLQSQDTKYVPEQKGVLYPRVGSLGGCTVHSAMFTFYPNNSDWDQIAQITGDSSWSAENMRKYFERIEQCNYVPRPSSGEGNPTRHGFDGWLTTEIADPKLYANDDKIRPILLSAIQELGLDESLLDRFFEGKLDPNDWQIDVKNVEGLYNIPLSTRNGHRNGPRQLIQETVAALPNNLIVKTHTLVTRILFDGTTAIGVEYLEGAHLYRADPVASTNGPEPGSRKQMLASREVILAAGAFNSPQILKLSGIGPADELLSHGIKPIVNLPGVGENLQDRYEVGVVTQLPSHFTLTASCNPTNLSADPCYAEWQQGKGIYTSNNIIIGNIWKSAPSRPVPDVIMFFAAGPFHGYYPGFSVDVTTVTDQFTWTILKAHTQNRAGTVKLRSTDPRDTPDITFHYFSEGSDKTGEDLESVVNAIELARRMNKRIGDLSQGELFPGPDYQSRDDIARFVANEAWGHHASCSNKMGPRQDPMAVVDSQFRVHGTKNLRIVDASVFPYIPGYFILTPIYMISEKASDLILASAKAKHSEKVS